MKSQEELGYEYIMNDAIINCDKYIYNNMRKPPIRDKCHSDQPRHQLSTVLLESSQST